MKRRSSVRCRKLLRPGGVYVLAVAYPEDALALVRHYTLNENMMFDAGKHGVYVSVVNTAYTERRQVRVRLPGSGAVTALASGAAVARGGEGVTLDLRPCQLLALRVDAP